MSYFEESARLIYDIYFAERTVRLKLIPLHFDPKRRAAPENQKKPLTAAEMSKIQNMASGIFYRRFHISYLNFDA